MHELGIKTSEGTGFPNAVSNWRRKHLALCALSAQSEMLTVFWLLADAQHDLSGRIPVLASVLAGSRGVLGAKGHPGLLFSQ